MPVNQGNARGWPFVNFSMGIRGTRTGGGSSRQTIVYPRRKFTYIAEFVVNPEAREISETNLSRFIDNGRIYAVLKSIEKPKSNFSFERLRSYNKDVIIPTKLEHQQGTMVFYDDDSSLASALWKEIRAFYQYEGRIGSNAVASGAPARLLNGEYRSGNDLVGDSVRNDSSSKPSLGITLRNSNARHFFDAIFIYDLGADPDSVNAYCYVYPFVSGVAFDSMDHEDAQSSSMVTFTFDYEGYYHLVGMNNSHFSEIAEQYLGYRFAPSPSVDGHVSMTSQVPLSEAGSFTIPFIGPR